MRKLYFISWPAATYDVKSCSHSNQSITKLVSNWARGKSEQLLQTWCFIAKEKTQKNLRQGWHANPPPPLYVRGLIWSIFYLSEKKVFKTSLRKQEFNIPCKFYLMSKAFLLTPSLSLTSFITCSSGSSNDLILCKKKENYTSALAKCIYF